MILNPTAAVRVSETRRWKDILGVLELLCITGPGEAYYEANSQNNKYGCLFTVLPW